MRCTKLKEKKCDFYGDRLALEARVIVCEIH